MPRGSRHYDTSLELYRNDALTAAKELGYPPVTSRLIRSAQTEDKISRILHDARMGKLHGL